MNQSTTINLSFDMMPVFDRLAKGFYHQWVAPQLPKSSYYTCFIGHSQNISAELEV